MEILLGIVIFFIMIKVMFTITSVFLKLILGMTLFLMMGLILPIAGIIIIPLVLIGFFLGFLKLIF